MWVVVAVAQLQVGVTEHALVELTAEVTEEATKHRLTLLAEAEHVLAAAQVLEAPQASRAASLPSRTLGPSCGLSRARIVLCGTSGRSPVAPWETSLTATSYREQTRCVTRRATLAIVTGGCKDHAVISAMCALFVSGHVRATRRIGSASMRRAGQASKLVQRHWTQKPRSTPPLLASKVKSFRRTTAYGKLRLVPCMPTKISVER